MSRMEDLSPTRSALLELQEENRSTREAHTFLDEKRTLLASALVQQVRRYAEARKAFDKAFALSQSALREAVAWQGLEALQCQPGQALAPGSLSTTRQLVLGVELVDAALQTAEKAEGECSPVISRCADQFARLAARAATLAAISGNLRRLYAAYQRTDRSARALENVLLPELRQATRQIEEHLEGIDLEEAVRVRCLRDD